MKILFSSKKVEDTCTSLKAAKKFFGGKEDLAKSLHANVNALKQAETLHDIIVQPPFHFHALDSRNKGKYKDLFAIDIKSRSHPWRLILQPLDENEIPFSPCNIDQISKAIRIVMIQEVSRHYG